jgi:hypothetical protein
MKVKAICIKTYIEEYALYNFIEGTIESLNKDNLFIKGKEYIVIKEWYDKDYFKLL